MIKGLKALWLRQAFPSQITAQKDSQGEDLPLNGTCLRDKTNKTKRMLQWLVLQNINDYL
jgi:hypothetical protein